MFQKQTKPKQNNKLRKNEATRVIIGGEFFEMIMARF